MLFGPLTASFCTYTHVALTLEHSKTLASSLVPACIALKVSKCHVYSSL